VSAAFDTALFQNKMNLKKKSQGKFKIFISFTDKLRKNSIEESTPTLLSSKQRAEEETINQGKPTYSLYSRLRRQR
jgi:hypothetical protein